MIHKHIKLINSSVATVTAMSENLDAQIAALIAKKREVSKAESRANLVKVAGNKSSTVEQLLAACYSFIGTHRLNSPRKQKPATETSSV